VKSPLRILLLEDNDYDAELIHELLEADQFVGEVTRVQTRAEFLAGLEDSGIELILADYKLPSFDGLSALKLALSARPDLPFIFVSGTLGEEAAIEALKVGATDYVLKTRLSRLGPSVRRALREARERAKREKAEEIARQSEKELLDVIEAIPIMAFTTLPDGSSAWVNRRWVEYSGLDETSGSRWQATLHPDDLDRHVTKWQQSLASGEPFENEARHRSANSEYRWFLVRAVPLRDEQGKIRKWYGTLTDIEDRKRAEQERERLRQLEADLAYMSRVMTMGELAASLAHEIKQPIAAAAMSAQACERWLCRDAPDLTKACESASAIIANVMRAAEIIDRVHSLYRRETPRHEVVQLNEIVREMTVLLSDTAHRNLVTIRTEFDVSLPTAAADRVQLQQIMMNLMLNGIEAMQATGGELRVTSKRTEDGQILISVSDSGMGLPVDGPDRIFEAFFTTKPQGTGMGLSISRRIIASHGGRLWASPNAGRGATFQFTLPPT
jgi:PAS domain S-box-containing protein